MSQYIRISLLALLTLVLAHSAGAGNTTTFTDPAGDVTGIPDIVSVTATSKDPSTVTVRVGFAEPADFGNGVGFALLLDSDDSRATGHAGDGVDYWFVLSRDNGSFRAERWDGSAFVPYGSTATGVVSGSSLSVRFDVRQLSRKGSVFRLEAGTYDETRQDEAPGLPEYFRFETRLHPVAVRFSPARPVAGKRFAVVQPGSGRCKATIARKALRSIGRCAWRIPTRAAGKRLKVVVGSRAYVFVVRRA